MRVTGRGRMAHQPRHGPLPNACDPPGNTFRGGEIELM